MILAHPKPYSFLERGIAPARFRQALRTLFTLSAVFLMLTATTEFAASQDIFGRISGTITDATGAVVPHAKITITNEETKLVRTVTSDDRGFYVVPELRVGVYSVSAEQKGFKTTTQAGNDLVAGARMTVDLTLQIGAVTDTVEVRTTGESVNTVSGEISRTINSEQVQHLALNERNYAQLVSLIPGAALTAFDQTALTTGMSTTSTSVNGLRADGNLFTVDGGFNLDSGSNATQLDNVGIDFIREVSVQTSNFSAEYGRNDGASVNVVTKSGGDKFHGSLFEFVRNDMFDAKNPASTNAAKPPLRFNDFGWSLGGPIKRGKLFFFAGEEWKRLRLAAAPQNMVLPTTAELGGNFTALLTGTALFPKTITLKVPANAPAGCTIVANVMSPQCITPNGQAIANVYALMEKQAASFLNTDGPNNTVFQPFNPQNWREDIARLDYQINDRQSMYFRYLHDNLNLIDAFGTFTPGGLPTTPTNRIRPGYSYQGGHVWTISPHLLNEAKFNVSWNKQRIPPTGNTWEDATYGFNIPLPFANAGRFPNGIPHVTFSGISGALPTVAPAQFAGPYFSLLAPTTDISPSDNFVWQTGRHTFKFGAMYARNRKDQNSRPNSPNGAINFSATNNPNSTGDPFADALIGNFQTFGQQSADPIGFFRFNDIEGYASDSWKITRKLNLELGVRYQHTGPTYTEGNNMVNFDPSLFTGCTTAVSKGNLPTSACLDQGFVIDGLVRGGPVPSDQLGRVPNGNSAFVTGVPATGQRGLFKAENLFAPRLGFAYSPFPGDKTVIRGGFGIFYDKPEGNVFFGQPGNVPFLQAANFSAGNLSNPSSGAAGIPTVFVLSAVDPNFVVARTMQYSLSVQHELPYGVLLETAYVGNLGRHEVRQPNINVESFATGLANPTANTNQIRPFLGYDNITQFRSDGNSNYNALQISGSKRKGDLVATVSYTYSKALGQTSGINDNPEPECPFTCLLSNGQTVSWRQFYWGPLSFDRRNIFVATYTYSLPFFRSQRGFAGQALGGWSFSGITRAQSGQPLTISGTQTIGPGGSGFSRRASLGSGALYDLSLCPAGKVCWFNPATTGTGAAFTLGPNSSAGTAPTGDIIGPGYYAWDMSLRKSFRMPLEGTNLTLQADAFNVFNRTNWGNPGTSASGGLGIITTANPPRQLQLGARFTF
jgi:Carboxypeptidase regulatory-like domain/TonB-dependent Receptor Plug Domain